MTVDPLYGAVRLVARFWIWFFFKSVEVRHRERVPAKGPVLLAVNHPNNLIDSLLVGAVLPRKVHYLATAALFRNPVLGRFLASMGVIPVYRKEDDPDKMEKNAATFEACIRAFDAGKLIAIYPEGTTHAEPRVQRIKTGAARIALEAEARRGGKLGPTLIPVGLTFEARKSFRSRVLVSFGEPISLAAPAKLYREDSRKAVDALTTTIQWSMEAQVIHVERIDLAAMIREVEALYRGDLIRGLQEELGLSPKQIDVFRLSRAIGSAVHHFKEKEPERVERLWQRIQEYQAMLAEYRVRDQAVRSRLEAPPLHRRLGASGLGAVGFPLFAYGALVNALPYFLPRWIARNMTHKETDYATARFLSAIVLFPLFWGLETWVVWRLTSLITALVFLASLPLSGLFASRYLGGIGRLRQRTRFARLALTRSHAASRLLTARQEILKELERAKNDYLAATKGSSF